MSTAARVRTTPAFLSLSWTFGLLQAFGVLAGIITILGVVLYLQARQQSREVSYALARRMGLRRSAHLRSILLELLAMLGAAFILGAATRWAGLVCAFNFVVAIAIGNIGAIKPLVLASEVLMLVGLGAVGWQVIAEPDEEWEHTPEFHGFAKAVTA